MDLPLQSLVKNNGYAGAIVPQNILKDANCAQHRNFDHWPNSNAGKNNTEILTAGSTNKSASAHDI
jgi:hypothetical protein